MLCEHNHQSCKVGFIGVALKESTELNQRHPVSLRNALGVLRPLELGRGELLPRIC